MLYSIQQPLAAPAGPVPELVPAPSTKEEQEVKAAFSRILEPTFKLIVIPTDDNIQLNRVR